MTPVPGAPGYYATPDGRVLSTWVCGQAGRPHAREPKALTLLPIGNGYLSVSMKINGVNAKRYLHAVIALTFIGPRPAGEQVRHLDGNKHNNCVANLAYGTARDNTDDSLRLGLIPTGERNGQAKLTAELVGQIRQLAGAGATHRAISERFGVTPSNVSMIVNRNTWRHVA